MYGEKQKGSYYRNGHYHCIPQTQTDLAGCSLAPKMNKTKNKIVKTVNERAVEHGE